MKLIDEGPATAAANMERSVELLEAGEPALHLYSWERPSVTFGHFFDPEKHFNLEEVARAGLDLARRPTGGGALFHVTDFAFALIIPTTHPLYSENTLQSYRQINALVAEGLRELFHASMLDREPASSIPFCMAQPTIYDLLVGDKKIGGAAQRRTRHGILHQGTLSLLPPDEKLVVSVLKKGSALYARMLENSAFLSGSLDVLRQMVRSALCQTFLNNQSM